MKRRIALTTLLVVFCILGIFLAYHFGMRKKVDLQRNNSVIQSGLTGYVLHKDITATLFWVGEDAGEDNDNISNSPSAWDDKWQEHFGGVDSPEKRNGFYPYSFVPQENPFYVALPYNDFNQDGQRRKHASEVVPWANMKEYGENESMLKNHWVKITNGSKTAYAQWEDVGPFVEDDSEYVFGSASPENETNDNAGIDVSPAVSAYLDLGGMNKVDWHFVDEKDVPEGPWKQIITISQIYWE